MYIVLRYNLRVTPSRTSIIAKRSAVFPDQQIVRRLARFRYELRKFLRSSEQAARSCGLTPQQYQLLLGVEGYTTRRKATISELSEFMQERHNSVVELVRRAERRGLVRKHHDVHDRRYVFVSLTPQGGAILWKLARFHAREVRRLKSDLLVPNKAGNLSRSLIATGHGPARQL